MFFIRLKSGVIGNKSCDFGPLLVEYVREANHWTGRQLFSRTLLDYLPYFRVPSPDRRLRRGER
jgi:hypothetical protein